MMTPPKLIILGLDSATWDLLGPWIDAGRLPHFAKIRSQGCNGHLKSIFPPITPGAWTSFLTGSNPGKHGIFNFTESKPGAYDIGFVVGGMRKVPTLWRLLSDAGMSVGTVNIPFTYPPEELNGYQISGADTPSERCDFVYPAELRKELEKRFGPLRLDMRHLGAMSTREQRRKVLQQMAEIDHQWTKVALHLMQTRPVDVMAVGYFTIDTVQHHFWQYMDPSHFMYDAECATEFRDAIFDAYARVDQALGEILSRVPETTPVLIMSDHGGGPVSDRIIYVNRALAQAGLLRYKPTKNSPVQKVVRKVVPFVFQVLQKTLSSRQKAWMADRLSAVRERVENSRFKMIDWSATKAYAQESNIWINRVGIRPQGIVTDEEYEDVLSNVKDVLTNIIDPRDQQPVIRQIYRRDEVYRGPETPFAPDLMLDMWGEAIFTIKPGSPDTVDGPLFELKPHKPTLEAEWGGTHRHHGILLFKGLGLKENHWVHGASLQDLAPTLLHFLGQQIPAEMDGQVLQQAWKNSVKQETEIDSTVHREGKSSPLTPEEESQIEERLRNLGYME